MSPHHPASDHKNVRRQTLRTDLGQHLRKLRNARRLTLAELGEVIQCSQVFLRKVEEGHLSPSLPMVQRLARALGVRSSSLVQEIVQSTGDHAAGRVTDREQDP